MKGNYYAPKWELYFVAHTPVCVRSRYILFKWYVTEMQISWPPFYWKKETPAALWEWRQKEGKKRKNKKGKTMENVANATGRVRHGSPSDPLSFPPPFFFTPHPTRVLDNRGAVRPSHSSVRSIRSSFGRLFAMDDLVDSSI